MCPLHSETLSLVPRKAVFIRYGWHEDSPFQKMKETTHSSCFTITFISFVHSAKFQPCTTQDKFSPSWVMWDFSSSNSTGGNAYLLFRDDFYVLYILQVWVLYDAQQVFSVMSDARTTFQKVPETTHTSFFIMILMSSVHPASLSFVGCTTCFRIIFMSLVHSSSFIQVRSSTNSLDLEYLDESIFQNLPSTAEIAGFMGISLSPVHSGNLRLVQRKTKFLRHDEIRT